jgi:hypothetical protein
MKRLMSQEKKRNPPTPDIQSEKGRPKMYYNNTENASSERRQGTMIERRRGKVRQGKERKKKETW